DQGGPGYRHVEAPFEQTRAVTREQQPLLRVPRAGKLEAALRALASSLGLLDQDPGHVRESGLLGLARRGSGLSDGAIEAMVRERQEAKQAKDFQRADRLRDELGQAGIVLEDSPQGTRWRRQ
ncbi:MAG: hypothetical protein EBV49_13185, partial [Betaproteobacteria bacterium]|nr:hypothetical protein [Betaproteobacteria bacterium]